MLFTIALLEIGLKIKHWLLYHVSVVAVVNHVLKVLINKLMYYNAICDI